MDHLLFQCGHNACSEDELKIAKISSTVEFEEILKRLQKDTEEHHDEQVKKLRRIKAKVMVIARFSHLRNKLNNDKVMMKKVMRD